MAFQDNISTVNSISFGSNLVGSRLCTFFPAVCNNLIAFSHFLCRPLLANTLKPNFNYSGKLRRALSIRNSFGRSIIAISGLHRTCQVIAIIFRHAAQHALAINFRPLKKKQTKKSVNASYQKLAEDTILLIWTFIFSEIRFFFVQQLYKYI